MENGTIVSLNIDRGFGFIESPGQPDLFFHVNDLTDGLEFNEQLRERRVKFNVVSSPKGPRAANIQAD